MIPKSYLTHINAESIGDPFASLPERIRQEAKTWPLGGISGRREFLEMIASRIEELESMLAAATPPKNSDAQS